MVGAKDFYRLFKGLIHFLHDKGIFYFAQVALPRKNALMGQKWKSANGIQIPYCFKDKWDKFVFRLKHCAFRLSREEDHLLWSSNESLGQITSKIAYEALCFSSLEVNAKWWSKAIWKWNVPLKIKLCTWLLIDNKILT